MSHSAFDSEEGEPRTSSLSYGTGVPESEYVEETENDARGPSDDQDSPTPWYRRKRFWAICVTINIILLIILLPLLFLVIFPAVAQSNINKSVITFDSLSIHLPMNETHFALDTVGTISGAGSFHATVSFPDGVQMVYNDVEISQMSMPTVTVSGGTSNLSSSGIVYVTNGQGFSQFVRDQLNEKNITFTLKGSVTVKALGISKSGLDLNKNITLPGSNGFRDPGAIKITGFNVFDNPNGSKTLEDVVTVQINNTSPVSVFLGTFGVHNVYKNVTLDQGIAQNLTMGSGINVFTVNGTVTPKSFVEIPVMNEYLSKLTNGEPINLTSISDYAKPDGIHEISWLSAGLKGLALPATLQMNKSDIVKAVSFGNVSLSFTKQNPYSPNISTFGSRITYKLPYGVAVTLKSVAQNLTLLYQNTPLAIYNSTRTQATNDPTTIYFDMPAAPLAVLNGQDQLFQSFLKNVTLSDVVSVELLGSSEVQGNTSLGPVVLSGVSFNVTAQLEGFGGFKTPANITKFSVNGGTPQALQASVEAILWNPSNNSLSMGDVNMAVKFQDVQIGNLLLPNFTLVPGSNIIDANATIQPNDTPQGAQALSAFLNHTATVLTMSGFQGSSDIASLVPALEAFNMTAILPGLIQNLLGSAALVVPDNIAQTKTAGTSIVFNNVFNTDISMFKLQGNATTGGFTVGNLNIDLGDKPVVVPANTNFTMPTLPIQLNLDQTAMFSLLRRSAVAQHLDTRPLDALLKLGNITVDGADPNVALDPSLFANFNLKDFVTQALHQIRMDVKITVTVAIGQYQTILNYFQADVTTTTDGSIVNLIPVLGLPIVQSLVSQTTTHFDKILLHDLSDTSFKADLNGVISNTGPFASTISFPNHVNVSSGGALLGIMNMPDITASNNAAPVVGTAGFLVADANALSKFSIQLLGTDSAEWQISADGMVVQTMGVTFNNITLSQSVPLKGSNGFKGQVQVLDLQLPGTAPEGGIAMDLDISLTNPGTVGVDPGSLQFNNFYKNVSVGPAASSGSVILPDAKNTIKLIGRITPKTDPHDIDAMSELFSLFMSGNDVEMTSVGAGVIPASGSCQWLSQAVKYLTIQIVLPGLKNVQLIPTINIKNLDMAFTQNTAYTPLTTSTGIAATLVNPFGFALIIQKIAQEMTLVNNNVPMIQASIPLSPVTLDPIAHTVTTKFNDIPFPVVKGQEDNFNIFIAELTASVNKTFTLQGKLSSITNTPSGTFNISNITYNVQTTVPGLQGLQSAPITMTNVIVNGGNSTDFLDISLTVGITNPSVIEVSAGDITLDVLVGDSFLGQTFMKNVTLATGQNSLQAQFRYEPPPAVLAGAGADMLGAFLENKSTILTIKGNPQSTNIASLAPTFSRLTLSSSLNGIGAQILSDVTMKGNPKNATLPFMSLAMHNPLDAPLAPTKFIATAFLAGTNEQVGLSNITLPIAIKIPPKGQFPASNLPFLITMNLTELIGIIKKDQGKVPVDIHLYATAIVGKFTSIINYFQENVIVTATL